MPDRPTAPTPAIVAAKSAEQHLVRRSLRDELAFLLDSTVDLPADAYDRDTLLMRLECAVMVRGDELAAQVAALREALAKIEPRWCKAKTDDVFGAFLIDEIDPVLLSTADAARAHDESVRSEEREALKQYLGHARVCAANLAKAMNPDDQAWVDSKCSCGFSAIAAAIRSAPGDEGRK